MSCDYGDYYIHPCRDRSAISSPMLSSFQISITRCVMQYKSELRWRIVLLVCIGLFIVISVFKISSAAGNSAGPDPQQDVIRLESRLTQLEQRLYAIETSVRTL